MAFTQEQKDKYLADKTRCPFCDSGSTTSDRCQTDGDSAWQSVMCDVCQKTWRDVYKFDYVETDEK